MTVNQQEIADLLKDCAQKYILPRYKNLRDGDVQTKSHANDFVTIADIETEAALVEILPKIVPGAIVIGEEGVSSGKITTKALGNIDKTIFIVDPVDGTYNFKNGNREFAVMMSLVQGGETRMAWIYDVLGDKHYITEKGSGAFCNDIRLHVSSRNNLSQSIGYGRKAYFPDEMRPYLGYLDDARKRVHSFRSLFCAAHEYINIASGSADFSISGRMNPWDHLAGALMVQEAGGVVAKWNKTPYIITDDTGGLLVASHQDLWDMAYNVFLKPVLERN